MTPASGGIPLRERVAKQMREGADVEWSADDIVRVFSIQKTHATVVIDQMLKKDLVVRTSRGRYKAKRFVVVPDAVIA